MLQHMYTLQKQFRMSDSATSKQYTQEVIHDIQLLMPSNLPAEEPVSQQNRGSNSLTRNDIPDIMADIHIGNNSKLCHPSTNPLQFIQ